MIDKHALIISILMLVGNATSFANSGDLKTTYRGVGVSAGMQTTSAAMFAHNGDKPYTTFNAEGGVLYMTKIGQSRFYFETGAYLGLINMGFDYYHDGPLERVVSRHCRLKIPFNCDYMIPLAGGFELIPSLGLGFTASVVSNISNETVEDTGLGFGIVFPHLGISLMKGNFMLGLSHEFFASIQSEIPFNGILQLKFAYLF